MAVYVSKHWSVREWDCFGRSQNDYAWDNECGRLSTNDDQTANLFKILDMLRDWNPNWVVNTTYAGYISGYRTTEVNSAVGGELNSYHTRGCAADISIWRQNDSDISLAETVIVAANAWGLGNQLGIGFYGNWIHIDTRGYPSRF